MGYGCAYRHKCSTAMRERANRRLATILLKIYSIRSADYVPKVSAVNSWIARLDSSKLLSSGEVISFREDGSLFVAAVSRDDRVFVVNRDDPTLLHAWGTVTGLSHEERLVIGDDEEANSSPYPTYEVASVQVRLKQTFGLPLSLFGYLSASDFKEYEDEYGNKYGGLVVEVPTALAAKLSEAIRIRIDADTSDMFSSRPP
jgi:hypothetical protein